MFLWVPCNGNAEVIVVLFSDVFDQVAGVLEIALRGQPFVLSHGRVTTKRQDIPHTYSFGSVKSLIDHGQLHVSQCQVHHNVQSGEALNMLTQLGCHV